MLDGVGCRLGVRLATWHPAPRMGPTRDGHPQGLWLSCGTNSSARRDHALWPECTGSRRLLTVSRTSTIRSMHRSRWFADVLLEASFPSEHIVLRELERVLDGARPKMINVSESSAVDGSFFLAHRDDCWGDIELEVDESHADLVSEVRMMRISAAEHGEEWPKRVALEVERIIRGRYRIEWVTWRGRTIHTTVIDQAGATIRDDSSRWERLRVPFRALSRGHYDLEYGCTSTPLHHS
jgi:hypothetical protein